MHMCVYVCLHEGKGERGVFISQVLSRQKMMHSKTLTGESQVKKLFIEVSQEYGVSPGSECRLTMNEHSFGFSSLFWFGDEAKFDKNRTSCNNVARFELFG